MERIYKHIIKKLTKRGSNPGLETTRELLRRLGNPGRKLSIVHCAGTNGKGSTLAFLASILTEAGYKVGRTMSPMIAEYRDQFRIGEEKIEEDDLDRLFVRIDQVSDAMIADGLPGPTLFEAETALAFLYFEEKEVDYLLLETGMGGALDATNVIASPRLCVITSISFDHMAFLGDTLSKIAAQKAGIIKPGCPVLAADNPPEVLSVIRQEADKKGSPFYRTDLAQITITEENAYGCTFRKGGSSFTTGLPGVHQVSNAVTAIDAACLLLPDLPPEILQRGIKKARIAGRLEWLCADPPVLRDGAHNPDGARALASYVRKHFTNKKINYIIGMLKDKDVSGALSYLVPDADAFYAFKPDNSRGLEAALLAGEIARLGGRVRTMPDVRTALHMALSGYTGSEVYIVCGSFSFMRDMEAECEDWKKNV